MLARKAYSTITIREFGLLLNGGDKSSMTTTQYRAMHLSGYWLTAKVITKIQLIL